MAISIGVNIGSGNGLSPDTFLSSQRIEHGDSKQSWNNTPVYRYELFLSPIYDLEYNTIIVTAPHIN